jgi:hypothetical protein
MWVIEGLYRSGVWPRGDPEVGGPFATIWPSEPYLETVQFLPPLPPPTRLRVQRLSMESPFDFLAQIPYQYWLAAGGSAGLFAFLGGIERAWNMPVRIRLERQRISREEAENIRDRERALLEAERIRVERTAFHDEVEERQEQYREAAQSAGFEAAEGSLSIPVDWEWPDRNKTERE